MTSDLSQRSARLSEGLLEKTASGRYRFTTREGVTYDGVVAVRAFPVSRPERGFSLMSADGQELVWLDRLEDLDAEAREIVSAALEEREFMPEIRQLVSVSGFVTPCTWHVESNRGSTRFVLKGEEDIRRLGGTALLITDSDGIHYLLRDVSSLDRHSRRLLDRFL